MHTCSSFLALMFYGIKVTIRRMYYPFTGVDIADLLQQFRFTGIPSVIILSLKTSEITWNECIMFIYVNNL